MSDQLSLRSRVVSLVISALDQVSESLAIEVRLEGSRLVVSADLAGVLDAPAKRAPGRPPTTAIVPASAVPTEPKRAQKAKSGRRKGGKPTKGAQKDKLPPPTSPKDARKFPEMAEAILAALGEDKNPTGLNLKKLAKVAGVSEKAKVKPVLAQLIKDGKLLFIKAGNLYRRKDVEVKPGRKPAGEKKKATAPKSPGAKESKKPAKVAKKAKKAKMSPAQMVASARREAAKTATKPAKVAKKKTAKKSIKGRKAASETAKAAPESTDEGDQDAQPPEGAEPGNA